MKRKIIVLCLILLGIGIFSNVQARCLDCWDYGSPYGVYRECRDVYVSHMPPPPPPGAYYGPRYGGYYNRFNIGFSVGSHHRHHSMHHARHMHGMRGSFNISI